MSQTSLEAPFTAVRLSLVDVLGEAWCRAVCRARAVLSGEAEADLFARAQEKVAWQDEARQARLQGLLAQVGTPVLGPVEAGAQGATTAAFAANSHPEAAPVSALGCYRIGENGRLYFTSKSEHYHAPLGHDFPGYQLIQRAQELGIPNATHNNTRGHATRLLEEALVASANGVETDDRAGLAAVLSSQAPGVLNRVLNLETGSLAMEAAIKLALSRFYRAQPEAPEPKYAGRIPVFVVMGDDEGGPAANYHGTTIVAQMLRGMWPDFIKGFETQGLMLVRSVRPNDAEELQRVFAEYNQGDYKIAAFFHELVLMNYAAKRLRRDFIQEAYRLCAASDTPTCVDEIQTGIWSPALFLFKEYDLKPDMVALGKGFPGGIYPASRLLFSSHLDALSQFGALVTNGQEELASLAYLITMRWVQENASAIDALGRYYQEGLEALRQEYPKLVAAIEGDRFLAGVYFHAIEPAKIFAQALNRRGLDISVQTYKLGCPPCALTKLPLIADKVVVDFVLARMREGLAEAEEGLSA